MNRGRLGNYPVITKYGLEQEMFGHYIFKDAVTIGGKKISSIEDLNNAVNTPIVQTISTTLTLEPNKYYSYVVSPGPSSMTITLSTPNDTTIVNTYMLSFTAGSNGTSLSLPADIK